MERSKNRGADKKQNHLRETEQSAVLGTEKKIGADSFDEHTAEHLTLAEAERFRTCRLNEPGAMAFIMEMNAHLMLCPHCRKLVQANNDLGDALDAAEEL